MVTILIAPPAPSVAKRAGMYPLYTSISAIWSMGISSSPRFPWVSTGTPLTSTLIFLPSMPRILILPSLPMPPDLRTLTPEDELTAFEILLLVFCSSVASMVEAVSTFFACLACSASASVSTESSSNCVTPVVGALFVFSSLATFADALSLVSSKKSSIDVTSSSWARAETAAIKVIEAMVKASVTNLNSNLFFIEDYSPASSSLIS